MNVYSGLQDNLQPHAPQQVPVHGWQGMFALQEINQMKHEMSYFKWQFNDDLSMLLDDFESPGP